MVLGRTEHMNYQYIVNFLRYVQENNEDVSIHWAKSVETKEVSFVGNFTKWKRENKIHIFNIDNFNSWCKSNEQPFEYMGKGRFKYYYNKW